MVDEDVLTEAWKQHKRVVMKWPRDGLGLDMDIAIRPSQLPNSILDFSEIQAMGLYI